MKSYYIDFNNFGPKDCLRLGTDNQFQERFGDLHEGDTIIAYSEDIDDDGDDAFMEVEATVRFDRVLKQWLACYDRTKLRWRKK